MESRCYEARCYGIPLLWSAIATDPRCHEPPVAMDPDGLKPVAMEMDDMNAVAMVPIATGDPDAVDPRCYGYTLLWTPVAMELPLLGAAVSHRAAAPPEVANAAGGAGPPGRFPPPRRERTNQIAGMEEGAGPEERSRKRSVGTAADLGTARDSPGHLETAQGQPGTGGDSPGHLGTAQGHLGTAQGPYRGGGPVPAQPGDPNLGGSWCPVGTSDPKLRGGLSRYRAVSPDPRPGTDR